MVGKRHNAISPWQLSTLMSLVATCAAIHSWRMEFLGRQDRNRTSVIGSSVDPSVFPFRDTMDKSVQARSSQVLHAVFTCNQPHYQALLNAQLETWAAGAFQEGRFYAVTGSGNASINAEFQNALIQAPCDDSFDGLACKEFFLEKEAFDRQAEWLAITGEDNYIDTATLEQKLSLVDPQEQLGPVALGITGCALWSCPELPDAVSICGGGGIFLNRAAINLLFADGADALRAEYMSKAGMPNDVITACALQKRGAKVMQWNSGLVANRIMRSDSLQVATSDPNTVLLHYLTTPAVMHWVHAVRLGHSTELEALKEDAFLDDCCCWYHDIQECKALSMNMIRLPGENFFDFMARLYIAQEQMEHAPRIH